MMLRKYLQKVIVISINANSCQPILLWVNSHNLESDNVCSIAMTASQLLKNQEVPLKFYCETKSPNSFI